MKPIIFAHFGDSNYLSYTLSLAKRFNPDTPIYLLGDEKNQKYVSLGVIHKRLNNYRSERQEKLLEVFQNISNIRGELHHKILLFCLIRWAIIYEFMIQRNIKQIWYFDSDTFVCSNLTDINDQLYPYKIAIINKINGAASLINSGNILKKYLDLAISLFQDKAFIENQKKILALSQKSYELCDMTFWGEYRKRYPKELGELSEIIDGKTFDPLIGLDKADQIHNLPLWEMTYFMGKKLKKIYMHYGETNHQAYCFHLILNRPIQMNTLNLGNCNLQIVKAIYNQFMKEDQK